MYPGVPKDQALLRHRHAQCGRMDGARLIRGIGKYLGESEVEHFHNPITRQHGVRGLQGPAGPA
jgi:hypothetical protein